AMAVIKVTIPHSAYSTPNSSTRASMHVAYIPKMKGRPDSKPLLVITLSAKLKSHEKLFEATVNWYHAARIPPPAVSIAITPRKQGIAEWILPWLRQAAIKEIVPNTTSSNR